ncbi:MAG: hypothetical protein WB785_07845 [Mycobacterium sp.]|uniref:hypothetical protein n=1 Tax=Mycobacterium sp. TaxID=1785 RepID=UPI003C4B217C
MTAVASTERTYAHLAAIADRLALQFDETVAAMDDAVIEVVPVFGADAAISAELTANNRAHLQRFLAVARHADPRDRTRSRLRRLTPPAPSCVAAST